MRRILSCSALLFLAWPTEPRAGTECDEAARISQQDPSENPARIRYEAFGWRDPVPESSQGFSIGVGALLDDEVKSFAKGFKVGELLPNGETVVRYETKARWSGLLFFTRTF